MLVSQQRHRNRYSRSFSVAPRQRRYHPRPQHHPYSLFSRMKHYFPNKVYFRIATPHQNSVASQWNNLKYMFECVVCYQETPFQIQCDKCAKSCCVECVQNVINAAMNLQWQNDWPSIISSNDKCRVPVKISDTVLSCPHCREKVDWKMNELISSISTVWQQMADMWFKDKCYTFVCPFCKHATITNVRHAITHVEKCPVRQHTCKCPSCLFVYQTDSKDISSREDTISALNDHWKSGECSFAATCIYCTEVVSIHEWANHSQRHVANIIHEGDAYLTASMFLLNYSQALYANLIKETNKDHIEKLIETWDEMVLVNQKMKIFLMECLKKRFLGIDTEYPYD